MCDLISLQANTWFVQRINDNREEERKDYYINPRGGQVQIQTWRAIIHGMRTLKMNMVHELPLADGYFKI